MTQAAQIVEHYRAKGLSGRKLVRAVAKHARLLEPHDRAVSQELWAARLFKGERMS